MEQKRSRSVNFTPDEKVICLNIIKKYKDIIECKKTDHVTWRDKDAAWLQIEKEFNSQSPSGIKRSRENLKKFYENKKKQTRKLATKAKMESVKTGGGGPDPASTKLFTDPTVELTMSILNKKSVLGMENPYDGDRNQSTSKASSQPTGPVETSEEDENMEVIVITADDNEVRKYILY